MVPDGRSPYVTLAAEYNSSSYDRRVALDKAGHTSAESGTILREIVAAFPGVRSLEEAANAGLRLYFLGSMQAERDGVPVPRDGLWRAAQVQLEGMWA